MRRLDSFVVEVFFESLDAGLEMRLAVCESVVLPAVEARLCGEIERDDRRAGYLYSLAAYMLLPSVSAFTAQVKSIPRSLSIFE